MKATITINGKSTKIELTPEQAETLGLVTKEVKRWKDLGGITGWVVMTFSKIAHVNDAYSTDIDRNVFATKNQARSALAMAQLSQLMKHVNEDWSPDWSSSTYKYAIYFINGRVHADSFINNAHFLAFPTEEIRNRFLENHRELIEEYFLMHKPDEEETN